MRQRQCVLTAHIPLSKPCADLSHAYLSALQALCAMVTPLGLPAALEHVLRPLLLQLPGEPHIALALLGLASAIGPAMAARHMLPPLLAMLSCPAKPSPGQAAGARLFPTKFAIVLTPSLLCCGLGALHGLAHPLHRWQDGQTGMLAR